MRSMPRAMPQSVWPTWIDIATRWSVSMLEPHWRLVLNEHDLEREAGQARTVAEQVNSPAPHDVAEADVLDHRVPDLRVAVEERAQHLRAGLVEAGGDELASAPRANAERAPSTSTTFCDFMSPPCVQCRRLRPRCARPGRRPDAGKTLKISRSRAKARQNAEKEHDPVLGVLFDCSEAESAPGV